jgi:hypothetical protein
MLKFYKQAKLVKNISKLMKILKKKKVRHSITVSDKKADKKGAKNVK